MLSSTLRIRLFVTFVLAGCFFFGCGKAGTRFYVLNPLDSGASLVSESAHKGRLSIEVVSLRLPQYLERPQIVTRSSGNRLVLAEYHQWGGNLRKNMIRVLSKNFSQILDTPHIAISPHRPPGPPDFRVELEVMQFERDAERKVRLSAQWRLSSGKDREPVTTRITELLSPVVPGDPDFEHTVSAMSTIFGELSTIIGQEILKHVNMRPDI
jgi:uncharacterized lipoprotein YmbA